MENTLKCTLLALDIKMAAKHSISDDIRLMVEMDVAKQIYTIVNNLKNGNYTDRRYGL